MAKAEFSPYTEGKCNHKYAICPRLHFRRKCDTIKEVLPKHIGLRTVFGGIYVERKNESCYVQL